jgi:hypothetical protein
MKTSVFITLYTTLKDNRRFVGTCRRKPASSSWQWCMLATYFTLLLREIMVTQHADRAMHAIVVGSGYYFYHYAYLPTLVSLSPIVKTILGVTMSWDSSVGIATGYGLDDRGGGSSSTGRVKNFLFSTSSRSVSGPTQSPIKWVPGVKRSSREVDHSPPASAKVKKMWIYTSTIPYAFMA